MARNRYRPYSKRGRRKSNNVWWSLVAIIVIVCGAFVLHKSRNDAGAVGGPDEVGTVKIDADTEKTRYELDLGTPSAADPEPEPFKAVITKVVEPGEKAIEAVVLPAVEVATEIVEPIAAGVSEVVEIVKDIVTGGDVIASRDKLNDSLMSGELSSVETLAVKRKLGELSKKWLFSRDVYPGDTLTGLYKVQGGDLLSKIGKKFNVPYQILMDINNIKRAANLRAGETIKVINGPFHARIYLSNFTMDLYLGNRTYVKTYRIGIGMEGKDTPTGRWLVKKGGKLVKPTWVDPDTNKRYLADDPDYPLGSRYIALDGLDGNAKGRTGFAVHGTKDPESISTRSSRGCIRLYNGDVLEFFSLVYEGLSEVRVVD